MKCNLPWKVMPCSLSVHYRVSLSPSRSDRRPWAPGSQEGDWPEVPWGAPVDHGEHRVMGVRPGKNHRKRSSRPTLSSCRRRQRLWGFGAVTSQRARPTGGTEAQYLDSQTRTVDKGCLLCRSGAGCQKGIQGLPGQTLEGRSTCHWPSDLQKRQNN